MEHKELGDTGVMIPEIGYGTWTEATVPPIHKAMEHGAFLIDTAEIYTTEDVVGEAIKDIRDQAFIVTKFHPSRFGRRDLLKQADESLRLLKTDYIDLYMPHWANPELSIEEGMGAMEELVDQGKVRFIGVSNFSVAQMQEAQSVMSKHRIVCNQMVYSLVERAIEPAGVLQYCQQNRITLMAYSPLSENFPHIMSMDRNGALSKIAAETGRTEAQTALNWCITEEHVVAIPRSNSLEHIEENCLASGWRLSAEHKSLLDDSFPVTTAKFRHATD